jgi:hypothetical protein
MLLDYRRAPLRKADTRFAAQPMNENGFRFMYACQRLPEPPLRAAPAFSFLTFFIRCPSEPA